MKIILIITILVTSLTTSEAQLFKRLTDRVQDKIERKVEDKLVEEMSERIANAAVKPMNKAIDNMFRESYKETYGKEYDDSEYEGDPEKQAAMMQAILANMYGSIELPEAYNFKYSMEIEVDDDGYGEKQEMTMHFDTDNKVMAFQGQDKEAKDKIMIMDVQHDQVIILDTKQKTAMGMPNVMKMAGAFAANEAAHQEYDKVNIEKTSKTKSFAGYQATMYKYENEDEKGEMYMSSSVPFSLYEIFGDILDQYSKNFLKSQTDLNENDMLLYAKIKNKKEKQESTWEVKKIKEDNWQIDCSKYKTTNLMND